MSDFRKKLCEVHKSFFRLFLEVCFSLMLSSLLYSSRLIFQLSPGLKIFLLLKNVERIHFVSPPSSHLISDCINKHTRTHDIITKESPCLYTCNFLLLKNYANEDETRASAAVDHKSTTHARV